MQCWCGSLIVGCWPYQLKRACECVLPPGKTFQSGGWVSGGNGEPGHHAGEQIRHMMAMQHPARGFARIQPNRPHRLRWNIYRVADRAVRGVSVEIHHLEHMPVQVPRMPHHRHVVESQMHPFAGSGGDWRVTAPSPPVDRPEVRLHGATQHDHVRPIHRARRERARPVSTCMTR